MCWHHVKTHWQHSVIGWIAIDLKDILFPLGMNYLGDSLTFHRVPSLEQNVSLSNTLSYGIHIRRSCTLVCF